MGWELSAAGAGPEAAAVQGYTTAFWWSAAIFLFGALFSGTLLRSGAQEVRHDAVGAPAMAHRPARPVARVA